MSGETKRRSEIIKNINEQERCHAVPVENEAGPGMPDINACIQGVVIDIELKYLRKLTDRYHVYGTQIAWTKARARAMGVVLWMLVVDEIGEIFVTLGCPHQSAGQYTFNREVWTKADTGCVVYQGKPDNWAKAIYNAARSLAP